MTEINSILKRNRVFFLCFCLWFIILGVLSIAFPKGESFIWINHWRSFPADIFFSVITWLGTAYFILPLAILCFFIKRKDLALGILISFVVSGIIVELLKHYFNYPRPALYFSDREMIRQVSWVPLRVKYSFPSGHTTSVFAAAAIAALYLSDKKRIAIICFALACLTAYSRIYLGEHFLEDVWIGSLIGMATGTFYYWQQSVRIKKRAKKETASCLSETLTKE